MAPDWFLDKAKKILHAMEYGQEYREAAKELWQELKTRNYLSATALESESTDSSAS